MPPIYAFPRPPDFLHANETINSMVEAFLLRVDELRSRQHVSDAMLLAMLPDFRMETALLSYRNIQHFRTMWNDFVVNFGMCCLPAGYNPRLEEEINHRKQTPHLLFLGIL